VTTAFSEASAACTATAHRTASTALAKSATTLSPAVLKIRPRCDAISSSMMARHAFSRRVQLGERADLVARHQPAVAGNVGGEDRSQFALYRMDRHAWLLPIRV